MDPQIQISSPVKPSDWNTRTYSQKVRWRSKNPDPLINYKDLVDKYQVKEIVRPYFNVSKSYLVVEQPCDIEAAGLPGTFVMKATHGWNMSLLVVDNVVQGGNRERIGAGRQADAEYLQQVAQKWFRSRRERRRRRSERQYQFVRPRILFEQFLQPVDYELQLFMFGGKCRLAMVFYRQFYHKGSTHRLYDERWQLLEPGSKAGASCYEWSKKPTPPLPQSLMHNLECICQPFDHVRADFYVSAGEYYFSEFTFTHNGGRGPGFISKYDRELSKFWLA
jgi:hypothetical protein